MDTFIIVVIILAVAGIGLTLLRSAQPRESQAVQSPARKPPTARPVKPSAGFGSSVVESPVRERTTERTNGRAHHWPVHGYFEFEIVGESHYQGEIAGLAGDHGMECAHQQCVAELVPEDTNRFDPKAVAVRIEGKTVGYLSREDARSFRRRLGQKGLSGSVTTCDAIIVGGGTRDNGERLFYGVKLAIKPFA